MICPFCQTENRDDREKCYACDKDISMLRLVVNKARHHYNLALEHAERGRVVQAIDELHHALDLDRSFVAAHVVLGTLHAKQNDFGKAREAWQAALALSPELSKAHKYLERVQVAETSLPIVRNLRLLAGILLGVLIVAAVVLLWCARPDPARAQVQAAQTALDKRQYGEALQLLKKARQKPIRSTDVRLAVASLQGAIAADLRQQVKLIQNLKLREDFPAALTAIKDLESRGPDPETSAALAIIKMDINHYYQRTIEEFSDEFNAGTIGYSEFADKVEEFLTAYPDSPEKDELRSYLARAKETEAERRVDQIQSGYEETRDVQATLEALQVLAAEHPGSEAVKKGRNEIVEQIFSDMFDDFKTYVGKRELDAAREVLQRINELADEFKDLDVSGGAQLATRVLNDTERAERLRHAEQLIGAGEFTEAQELLDDLRMDELTPAEEELLDSYQVNLTHREAQDEVLELRKDEDKYLKLQISDEVASETLARYKSLLNFLPRTDTGSRVRVMCYAAASALKLGQRDKAEELVDLAEKAERSSPMVKTLRAQLKKKGR